MLDRYFHLMRWWLRRWYFVFRRVGRITNQEEYIERAINVTEENFERILEGDDK